MKTLLVAASAAALNTAAFAGVIASSQNPMVGNQIAAPTGHQTVTTTSPASDTIGKPAMAGEQASKWAWIPSQRGNDGAPQTQIVAIPVPSPGAAAIVGLSGLIFTRRRVAN